MLRGVYPAFSRRGCHLRWLLLILPLLLALGGCFGRPGDELPPEVDEQLYIDANQGFTVIHPLDWQRLKHPVSSPRFRSDTVHWRIGSDSSGAEHAGSMLIRSYVREQVEDLPSLLSTFLADQPELATDKAEPFSHPAGEALRLLSRSTDRGRLSIAIAGQRRYYLLSLDSPADRFDELLPIFQNIVNSFRELPAAQPE